MVRKFNTSEEFDQFWDRFGYTVKGGCDICGKKPAKSEPRFGYNACKDHCRLGPIRFGDVRDGLEADPLKDPSHHFKRKL